MICHARGRKCKEDNNATIVEKDARSSHSVQRKPTTSRSVYSYGKAGILLLFLLYGFVRSLLLQQQVTRHDDYIDDIDIYTTTRIAVSMKTIPSRIDFIEPTLLSLLANQTTPLDQLYITLPRMKWILPKDEPIIYKIPRFLEDMMQKDSRVIILRPQYDYGPVDKILHSLIKESESTTDTETTLIYLDDDVIYDSVLIQNLVQKGLEYPDSAIGFNGCNLRSHFRQVSHRFPKAKYDRHPNLYYITSGTKSLRKDEIVDVVQGFTGVLIRPQFFDLQEFLSLVENVTTKDDIWKADDFIVSGYLEYRNITRRVVLGGMIPILNQEAAGKDNVGRGMYRQITQAAYDLQDRLGIWRNLIFVDYMSMTPHQKDLMDCEAGHKTQCKKVGMRRGPNVTLVLDESLLST